MLAHPGIVGLHAMITIFGITFRINWVEFIDYFAVIGAVALIASGVLYVNGKRQQAVFAFVGVMLGVVVGMFLAAFLGVV